MPSVKSHIVHLNDYCPILIVLVAFNAMYDSNTIKESLRSISAVAWNYKEAEVE